MIELTPEVIKKLSPEQLELLAELGDLARSELELTAKIDNTRKAADKVGLNRDKRTTKAIHEDQDYDELLSIRSIKEREVIRDRISSMLKSLVEVGLGDLSLVKRQASNYNIDLDAKE